VAQEAVLVRARAFLLRHQCCGRHFGAIARTSPRTLAKTSFRGQMEIFYYTISWFISCDGGVRGSFVISALRALFFSAGESADNGGLAIGFRVAGELLDRSHSPR